MKYEGGGGGGGVVKLTCRHPLPSRKTTLKKPSLIRVNDKNVPELPEIEVFVDSNKNFTIKAFAWGVADTRDV